MTKHSNPNQKFIFLIIFLLISCSGVAFILYTTAWAPWAFSDSAAYVSSAKNFNNGMGLTLISASGKVRPLEHYPPLYPLTLSALARLGLDYLVAARFLDAFLFGMLIFTLSFGIYLITNRLWLAFICGSLILVSPMLIEDFSGVMSEPMFITLSYAAVLLILFYIKKNKLNLLCLAAILSGLTPLIRYVGIFLILVNITLVLVLERKTWKERLQHALVYGLLSALPIGIWLLSVFINSGSIGARGLVQSTSLNQGLAIFFRDTSRTFKSWLPYIDYRNNIFPDELKTTFFVAIVTIIILISLFIFIRNRHAKQAISTDEQILVASFLIIFFYLLTLCASYLLTRPAPDINSRMLSPLLPALALFFIFCLFFITANINKRPRSVIFVILTLFTIFIIRYYAIRSLAMGNTMHENGYGYTSQEIQTSGFLDKIKSISADELMLSNLPDLILLYTNKLPYGLESIPNYPFMVEKSSRETLFREQHAALILDFASLRNIHQDWQDRLNMFTKNLDIFYKDEVGGIYYYPQAEKP